MNRVIAWIASWADTMRVGVYGPEVLREPVDGQKAWEEYQADFNARRDAERAKHGRVSAVEAERRSFVHSALRASSPPSQVAGGCSRSEAA